MMIPPQAQKTLPCLFFDRFARYGKREALFIKSSEGSGISSISWEAWGQAVTETAAGLRHRGVRRGDRVAILSENRPEWTFADLAILTLGAVTVPVYPTSSPKEAAYILQDSGVQVLFLSTFEHYQRIQADLPSAIKTVILFDAPSVCEGPCVPFLSVRNEGRRQAEANSDFIENCLKELHPEDLATLIYTSGTTGPPKGVMLTHSNFIENFEGASKVIKVDERDLALSFLPLSHVFERLAGYYFFALNGGSIAYAESMKTVPDDLILFKPTVAASVPRLYEKMYAAIHEKVAKAGPVSRKLFAWALQVGARKLHYDKLGCAPLGWKLQFWAAQKLVLSKIRARLGGRLRFFISGGAPLSRELGEFFYAAGVLILEGYGLTETSPVIAVNAQSALKFGSVGKPLYNVEVKIAADGEILTRGPCVMKGYYKNDAATKEVLKDGWFHTGDIGEFDNEGYLRITDRKKDLIVTSGGKNISPQNIENLILGDPVFLNVVVVGDKKNYLVALVALNRPAAITAAQAQGIAQQNWEELVLSPAFYQLIEARIRERTQDLSRYEQIKYFAFLEKELSQDAGELTPTLKVKRKVVVEKYRHLIEELYKRGEKQGPVNS